MKNCAQSNGGLTTMLNEVDVRFITLLSPFDRTQGCVGGGKAGRLTLNITSIQRYGCFKLNAMKNCAQSNGGLTTMLGEVDVRFIVLLSPFDRTQGRVGGGKSS